MSVHFYLESENQKLTLPEYGYWLVRWSHDGAMGSVDELKASKYKVAPIVEIILTNYFAAYIQYLAIYIASYWCYATLVLGASEETALEMKRGLNDGLKALRNGTDPFDPRLMKYLQESYVMYSNAITNDHFSKADSESFNPDINTLAKNHVGMMSQSYASMTEVDRFTLGHFAADIPDLLWKSVRENLKLKLRQ